jgi:hypothetical protein
LKAISLDVVDQAHAGKLLFRGFVVLGVLNCGQAFFKSANVGRIIGVGQDVIRKAKPAGKILREEFRDCFVRKTQIGQAFAIRFADELVCPLHKALPLLETLNVIDQLFGSIRVIAKNDHVRFGGGRPPAAALGLIVMFLRLRKMPIEALKRLRSLRWRFSERCPTGIG